MADMSEHDVIIVGSGLGGLITGALLAKKENMKVLVLEQGAEIGGRMLSFGGPHGQYSAKEFLRLLSECAGVRVVCSDPPLEEIIEKGIFRDSIIDTGWHGPNGGARSRMSIIAKALGKSFKFLPQVGVAYYEDGRWASVSDMMESWPKASIEEKNRVARERLAISIEEAAEWDHVDLESFLKSRTDDKIVQDHYLSLARYNFGVNDMSRVSAGMWINVNNLSSNLGLNIFVGGATGPFEGGAKHVTNVFAEVIEENGGEIRTRAKVKEVIIEKYRAVGVVVEQDGKTTTIQAPKIVSNIPMDKVFDIIAEEHFPQDLRQRCKNVFPLSGHLGHIKVRRLLETEMPKAFFMAQHLPGIELGGAEPLFSFEQTSAIDPSRILDGGGHLISTWVAVSYRDPDEVHDRELMLKVSEAVMAFFRKQYPQFDEILESYFFVTGDRCSITYAPGHVGDRLPPVQHPLIRNLFFTGDTVKQWDGGMNGAAQGGINCASAVAGKDFRTLLPPTMR